MDLAAFYSVARELESSALKGLFCPRDHLRIAKLLFDVH